MDEMNSVANITDQMLSSMSNSQKMIPSESNNSISSYIDDNEKAKIAMCYIPAMIAEFQKPRFEPRDNAIPFARTWRSQIADLGIKSNLIPTDTVEIRALCERIAVCYSYVYPDYKRSMMINNDDEDIIEAFTILLQYMLKEQQRCRRRGQIKYREIDFVTEVEDEMNGIQVFTAFEIRRVYYYVKNLSLTKKEIDHIDLLYQQK